MDDALRAGVAAALNDEVIAMTAVRGGDVAEAYRVTMASGVTVFAKTHRSPPPGFFTTEAAGLRWLREPAVLAVPEVLAVHDGHPDGVAMLVLEWIQEGGEPSNDEGAFGRALAELHRAGAPSFGREDRCTTGSRALPNEPCATWDEFIATQRLGPIATLVFSAVHLDNRLAQRIDAVANRVSDFGAGHEAPARLHGDLWAGNRLVDRDGQPWLIDPACFGGHREFDLAMMRLFGGFGDAAFAAYDDAFPLAAGWEGRVPLHQLAPLAIHAIKFGGSYVSALDRALSALGG
ncbi:MAG: hypothetical protein QOJ00_2851 [Actinomycetota bacterium]